MNFKKCSILVSAGIGALLLVAGTARAEDGMESMKYAVGCKAEGAEGAKCLDARRELVKYSTHCKAEGDDGKHCMQAREVVKAHKLAEQPGIASPTPTAKAMPAAAAAKAAGKDDLDIAYAMHCKAEGEEAKRCMGMRDKLGKYAGQCKEEGADGERCQTAHKAMTMMKGK